jgi:hypothetical protein
MHKHVLTARRLQENSRDGMTNFERGRKRPLGSKSWRPWRWRVKISRTFSIINAKARLWTQFWTTSIHTHPHSRPWNIAKRTSFSKVMMGSFPGNKHSRSVKLTTSFHLVSRKRICGTSLTGTFCIFYWKLPTILRFTRVRKEGKVVPVIN